MKTMLSFWYYIISSLTRVYLKVIVNIQCYTWFMRTVFIYNKHKDNIDTNYVRILVTSNSPVTTIYNEVVVRIQRQFLFTSWVLVYTTETRNVYNIYVIIIFWYLCSAIYVMNKITANIQCYIVLTTRKIINRFDKEWFQKKTSEFWSYMICSLTMVYFKFIDAIQC